MPYIKQEDRKQYDAVLNQIKEIYGQEELEHCILKLMEIYMSDKEFRYSTLHDCTYSPMHCADEARRRFLNPSCYSSEDNVVEINHKDFFEHKDFYSCDHIIDQIKNIKVKGDLEYCIFKLMRIYVSNKRDYDIIFCINSATFCAHEFRKYYLDRREDQAIKENGDVSIV